MPLERLIYRSHATPLYRGDTGLADLLAQSRRNNRAVDITGALAVSDNVFVQVIEGLSPHLDRLLENLAADSRHSSISILGRWAVSGRMFSTWSMASAALTNAPPLAHQRFQSDGLGLELVSLLLNFSEDADPYRS